MSNEILAKNNEKSDKYKEYMERIGKEKIPCYEPLLGKEEIERFNLSHRKWLVIRRTFY